MVIFLTEFSYMSDSYALDKDDKSGIIVTEKVEYISHLLEFTSAAIWFQSCLCWRVLMTDSISILVTDIFRLSISSWFSLSRLWTISSSLCSLLMCKCSWKLFVIKKKFCDTNCKISSSISDFIRVFSFYLTFSKGLLVLFIFLKIFTRSFVDFFYCISFSISFISALIFVISILLLT